MSVNWCSLVYECFCTCFQIITNDLNTPTQPVTNKYIGILGSFGHLFKYLAPNQQKMYQFYF